MHSILILVLNGILQSSSLSIGFLHGFENGLGKPVTSSWSNRRLSSCERSEREKDESAAITSVWMTSTFLNHVGTLFLDDFF